MKKTYFITFTLITLIITSTAYDYYESKNISYKIIKEFMINIGIEKAIGIDKFNTSIVDSLLSGVNTKKAITDNKFEFEINCTDGIIQYYKNNNTYNYNINKYIDRYNKLIELPFFVDFNKAKHIFKQLEKQKIISSDYELSDIIQDKHNGTWTGIWKRMLHGAEVENDYISLSIMSTDGSLYTYFRSPIMNTCNNETLILTNSMFSWVSVSKSCSSNDLKRLLLSPLQNGSELKNLTHS